MVEEEKAKETSICIKATTLMATTYLLIFFLKRYSLLPTFRVLSALLLLLLLLLLLSLSLTHSKSSRKIKE